MGRKRKEHGPDIRPMSELIESPVYDDEMLDCMIQEIEKNIYRISVEKHISKKELAFLTGIHPTHLCNVLSGKARIGLNTLIKVAVVLNCDIGELIPIHKSQTHTLGDRFNAITKDLTVPEKNFVLKMTYDYVKSQQALHEIFRRNMQ